MAIYLGSKTTKLNGLAGLLLLIFSVLRGEVANLNLQNNLDLGDHLDIEKITKVLKVPDESNFGQNKVILDCSCVSAKIVDHANGFYFLEISRNPEYIGAKRYFKANGIIKDKIRFSVALTISPSLSIQVAEKENSDGSKDFLINSHENVSLNRAQVEILGRYLDTEINAVSRNKLDGKVKLKDGYLVSSDDAIGKLTVRSPDWPKEYIPQALISLTSKQKIISIPSEINLGVVGAGEKFEKSILISSDNEAFEIIKARCGDGEVSVNMKRKGVWQLIVKGTVPKNISTLFNSTIICEAEHPRMEFRINILGVVHKTTTCCG